MCVAMRIVDESVNHGFAKVMWTCACCMPSVWEITSMSYELGLLDSWCDKYLYETEFYFNLKFRYLSMTSVGGTCKTNFILPY